MAHLYDVGHGRLCAVPITIATDGSTIEYEVHGDGPTLLLVPGLGFGPWGFFKQLPALSRRFRAVTFYLGAPRDRDYGVTELALDAAALLDSLGTGRAHVLGTSLGGFVAQELALARPDLVDRLVLISTSSGGRGGGGRGARVLARAGPDVGDRVVLLGASYGGRGGERMSARVLAAMFGVGSFSPEGAVRRGLKAATSARYRADDGERGGA